MVKSHENPSLLQKWIATTELLPRTSSYLRFSNQKIHSLREEGEKKGYLESDFSQELLHHYDDIHRRFLEKYKGRFGKRWINRVFKSYKNRIFIVKDTHMGNFKSIIFNDAALRQDNANEGEFYRNFNIINVTKPHKYDTDKLAQEQFRWTLTEEMTHAILETPALKRRLLALRQLHSWGQERILNYLSRPHEWVAKAITFDILYGSEELNNIPIGNRFLRHEKTSIGMGAAKIRELGWTNILNGMYLGKNTFGEYMPIPKLWYLRKHKK